MEPHTHARHVLHTHRHVHSVYGVAYNELHGQLALTGTGAGAGAGAGAAAAVGSSWYKSCSINSCLATSNPS